MTHYVIHLLTVTCLFAAMATSYNLLIALGRLFSIAQAAFVGIGAYAVGAGMLNFGLPFVVALVVGVVAGAVVGLLLGAVALRVADVYLAIASFAFQELFVSSVINLKSITSGGYGLPGIPPPAFGPIVFNTPYHQLLMALVVLAIALEVYRRLDRSPFGRVMRCAGADEVAVRALGKNVWQGKLAIFTISGALAAFAGAFYASYIGYIDPTTFTIDTSILLLSMVIFGGAGAILGPVIGALVIVDLPDVLSFVGATGPQVSNIRQVAYGLALLLVLLLARRGVLLPKVRELRSVTGTEPAVVGESRGGIAVVAIELNKRFGGVHAINDLSVTIPAGRVTGIVGPNGAGKTTLFDLLTGFVQADSGRVLLAGQPLDGKGPERRAREGVVRSFQDLKLFGELSAVENVRVALQDQRAEGAITALLRRRRVARAEAESLARAHALLDRVGFEGDPSRRADELSYGEQKLLSVARIAAAAPAVMLLDEPASGLDHASLDRVGAVVRGLAAQGVTVCVIEHNVQLLSQLADHMLFLHMGALMAEGTPQAIMADPELGTIYFGLAAVR